MSDFTILPSRFDGWGAVVNESLSVGTPVVVSRYCGASELLRGRASLGRVLERLDPVSLAEAIEEAALKGCTGADQRQRIAEWARTVISGESLCRYFLEILERADSGADSVLAAPWESLDPISEHQRPMA
jgi:glycosyltransferase involved in cell wall biosynthesis